MPGAHAPLDGATLTFELPGLPATVIVTTAKAGDLRPGAEGAAGRQAAVCPGPWSVTRQVRGGAVARAGDELKEADALVGRPSDRVAMFAADCCLLGLVSPEGHVAAVHAGWQGLRAGVVEAAAAALRAEGAGEILAVLGASIRPECYEFGGEDLETVTAVYGEAVAARTAAGSLALDLPAGVKIACERAGIEVLHEVEECTACARAPDGSYRYFSHRARAETERHALVVTPNDGR